MSTYSGGLPGPQSQQQNQPRDIFWANRDHAQYIALPAVIDGSKSQNPSNSPYTFYLYAGTLMGRITASGKYAPSVLGATTVAYTSGGTSLTVDPAVAAYLVARNGGSSGTFKTVGPPTAAGTVATTTTTFSAVNTTTGVITVTSLGVDKVAGSFISPTDGSETILTLICDINGIKCADGTNVNTVDAFDPQLLLGGGTINTGLIVNYPADASLKTYVKNAIKAFCANGVTFLDDLTG